MPRSTATKTPKIIKTPSLKLLRDLERWNEELEQLDREIDKLFSVDALEPMNAEIRDALNHLYAARKALATIDSRLEV